MRSTLAPLFAGTLLAAAACADPSPLAPAGDAARASRSTTTPGTGPWARVVEGETGPGALYALYVPRAWNGEAVYYAHGIRPPLESISLRDQDNFYTLRDALGEQGYAFAYSSFSENGLAVKDGAQRTHQLRGLLAAEVSRTPTRSYLAAHSLGALVALDLAERFPGQYDGVLAMCGMVGGTPRELQYVGDVRALFDFFYPGVLPGTVISVPSEPLTVPQVQALVVGAITTNPTGLFAIASTAQTPLAYAPVGSLTNPASPAFQSLVGSLVTALYYQLLGTPDLLDRTHGHSPYDNRATVYTLGTPVIADPRLAGAIAAANAGVARYDIAPDARNVLEKYYVPTGALRIPVVTVHNLWDPLVPYFHETALASAVNAAGASSMLLQRAVPNYGHCNFSAPLMVESFRTLATWVATGVKPAS